MSIFERIFGRHPEAPRSAEEPATDHIWPGEIRKSLRRKGFSKTEAAAIYFHLFDPRDGLISVAVDAGKDVHLTGLGKFTRREMGAGQRELPVRRGRGRARAPLPRLGELPQVAGSRQRQGANPVNRGCGGRSMRSQGFALRPCRAPCRGPGRANGTRGTASMCSRRSRGGNTTCCSRTLRMRCPSSYYSRSGNGGHRRWSDTAIMTRWWRWFLEAAATASKPTSAMLVFC